MAEQRPRRSVSLVPDGEFVLTAEDFRAIAALVHGESGIVLHEGKVNLVYSRLAKRLRAIGIGTFREYCELVHSESGVDERQAMIAALTTNVTRFFREPHHFDYFEQHVMPGIAKELKSGGRARLWSAGCSSGEEPYSIALTLLGKLPEAAQGDLLILATDIDPNMIAHGREGVYGAQQASHIPAQYRSQWTIADSRSGALRMAPAVRSLVRFNELNLLNPWPIRGKFKAIFCRNVMIYFDEETQSGIWRRFAQHLEPGGVLFIGHSERIATDDLPFELVAQTTYRLKQKVRA